MCHEHSDESYSFHRHDFITNQVKVSFRFTSGVVFQFYVL